MKKATKAAWSYCISATEDSNTHKEWILTTYCQYVNYLLETYTTDDVIAEGEAYVMDYKQPENMSVVHHLK